MLDTLRCRICRRWSEVCIRQEGQWWEALLLRRHASGLPEFGGVSPVQAPTQPTVESFLLHTVQQQQNQVAQLTALVQTLVSREPAVVQRERELVET